MGTTEPWKRWPRRMLRHKALIQAARIAFGFAGIYDEDEGNRMAEVPDLSAPSDASAEEPPKNVTTSEKLRSALGLKTGTQIAQEAEQPPAEAATPQNAQKGAKDGFVSVDSLI